MKNTRVNEIDLLRFCAALAVVFFHYAFRGYAADGLSLLHYPRLEPIAKYGYLGVELFFIISGFVILMTAESGSLRSFLISRIARLYPAFWVCCTITYLVTIAIGEPVFTATFKQYLANMTMFSEFFKVPSLDGAYWSLFVELKFYAMVAIVLIFKKIDKAQLWISIWLAVSIILEFVPTIDTLHIAKIRYWLDTEYAALFIAGAAFYLIRSKGVSPQRLAIIGISWCLAVYQATQDVLPGFVERYKVSMSGFVVAGLITSFYAIMFLVALQRTGAFAQKRWIMVGALTYPLYLLHEHIGFMIFNKTFLTISHHILFWGVIGLMLVAAFIVHTLVEKPFAALLKNIMNSLADSGLRLTKRFSKTNTLSEAD